LLTMVMNITKWLTSTTTIETINHIKSCRNTTAFLLLKLES